MVGTPELRGTARDPEMREEYMERSRFGEMLDGPGPTMEELEAFQLFATNDDVLATYRLEHPSLEGSAASASTLIIVRPTQSRSFSDDVPVQPFPVIVKDRPRVEPRRQSTSDLPTLATTRTKDFSVTQDNRKRSPSPFRDFIRGRRRSELSIDLPSSPPSPHAIPSQAIVVQDLRSAPRKLRKSRLTPELRVQTPPPSGSPIRSPTWSPMFTGEPESSSPVADRPNGSRRRSWRTSFTGFSNHSGSFPTSPSTDVSPTSAIRPPSPLAAFPSAARREGALPSVDKAKGSKPKRGSGHSSDSYHGDAEGDSSSRRNRTSSADDSPPSPSSTRNGKWKALKLGFGGGSSSAKKYTRSDSGKSDTSSWEWVSDSGGGSRSPVSPTFEVFRRPGGRPSFSRSKSAASVESTSSSHLLVPSTCDIGTLGSASTSSPNLTKIDETIEPMPSVRLRPPRLAFASIASAPPVQGDLTPKASPTLQLTSMDFAMSKEVAKPSAPRSIVSSLLTQTRPVETSEIHPSCSEGEPLDNRYQLPRSPALSNLGPGTPVITSRNDRAKLTRPSDSDLSFDTNDSILERDDGDETPASSALEDGRDSETEEEEEESAIACGADEKGKEAVFFAQETI